MTTAELSLSVVVALNAGALVYGAAVIKTEVRLLKDVVSDAKAAIKDMAAVVSDHDGRLISTEKDGTRALNGLENLRNQIVSGFEDLRIRVRELELQK